MAIVIWVLTGIWFLMALTAVTNAFLVPKVARGSGRFGTVLIPARDEEDNLRRLLPGLIAEVEQVIVYDDGSGDATGDVAREFGATVIRGDGVLPEGWTGKNHACWQLAKVVAEAGKSDWWIFMDADTQVEEGFGGSLASLTRVMGGKYPVMTGFPRILPGAFPEPAYLMWVPWILLSTIPFGLIYQSGMGHARFTNGQIVLWNSARYFDINPHEECKGEVLEDVKIGRLLARKGVRVLTADLSRVMSVQMYRTTGEAWRGMLKNSYWVTGHPVGAALLGVLLLGLAGVVFVNLWACLAAFATVFLTVLATGMPWYCVVLFPLAPVFAGVTQFGSLGAVLSGGVEWKGRKY